MFEVPNEDIHFYLKKNDDRFDIILLTDWKKGYDIKQFIKDETYQNPMKLLFKKPNIFSTYFVHFGLGIGNISIELNKIELQYIKHLGDWKPDTQH